MRSFDGIHLDNALSDYYGVTKTTPITPSTYLPTTYNPKQKNRGFTPPQVFADTTKEPHWARLNNGGIRIEITGNVLEETITPIGIPPKTSIENNLKAKATQDFSNTPTETNKTSFDIWMEDNERYISDTKMQEAIYFLEGESGVRINRIIPDNRWRYLDRKQKHGYIAKCEKDNTGRSRLKVTYHTFKHGGETSTFNDLGVLYNLWEAEKQGRKYRHTPSHKQKWKGNDNYGKDKNTKNSEQSEVNKKQKFKQALDQHLKSPQAAKSNYLKEKRLPILQGIKGWANYYGNTLVSLPIINILGQVIGLQQIFDKPIEEVGNKLFKGKTKGGFVFIYEGRVLTELPEKLKGVLVCEGFATGMSLHLATGLPVACALSADNVSKVAGAFRKKYGSRSQFEITICADNDELRAKQINPKTGKVKGNVGLEKAHNAAIKYNCNICAPDFFGAEGTDFNDLYASFGVAAVRESVSNAGLPDPSEAFAKSKRKLVVGDRYLPEIEELPDGITLVKSPQNTGKTQAITSLVRNFRDNGVSVVNITHRESLATHLGERLGLESYKDLTARDMRLQSGLSICVDSLHKLSGCEFEVVIIDESEQFVNNLKSGHIQNKSANLEVLTHLIKNAKKIVCLDADLGALTHTFVNLLSPELERKIINNHYFVGEGKNLYVHQKRGDVLVKAKETLQEDKTLLHVCNGLGESEKVYQLLSELFLEKRGLLINSETSDSPEVREVLNDPSQLTQYDFVVASPSLQTGVSIDGDIFDVVTGTFYTAIGTPDDCLQQIWRSRETKDIHVWVEARNLYQSYDDEILEAPFTDSYEKERELLGKSEHGVYSDLYRQVKIQAERQERKAKSNYRYNFLKLATLQGFDVELVEVKDEIKIAEGKELSQLSKILGEQVYADNRVMARDITAKEASKLAAKQSLTSEETYQLDKYMLKHTFRYDTNRGKDAARATVKRKQKIEADTFDDDTLLGEFIKVDNRGKYQKAVRNFELAFKTEQQIKELADELEKKKELVGDIDNVACQQLLNRVVLEHVGFKEAFEGKEFRYSKNTLITLVDWAQDNYSWLRGLSNFPSMEKLASNPCRYVGGWLRQMGLDHRRVGTHAVSDNQYALSLESVEEMVEWVGVRGEVVVG